VETAVKYYYTFQVLAGETFSEAERLIAEALRTETPPTGGRAVIPFGAPRDRGLEEDLVFEKTAAIRAIEQLVASAITQTPDHVLYYRGVIEAGNCLHFLLRGRIAELVPELATEWNAFASTGLLCRPNTHDWLHRDATPKDRMLRRIARFYRPWDYSARAFLYALFDCLSNGRGSEEGIILTGRRVGTTT